MTSPIQRWAARGTQALVCICLVMTTASAWADVEQAQLEKAEALLKAGKAEEAYQMLEPLEAIGAGDQVYDYLLGTAALESNRPSKATFVYERILAVSPAYLGVRADMGRAYFALGDYGRAKIEFETVLSFQNLPPDLRSAVEQYVIAAEARSRNKRTIANGYIELGIGRDSNVGSSTDIPSFNLATGPYTPTAPSGLKTADNYSTLGLGGEVNHQLSDQWGMYVGGDYRGRAYQTYSDPGTWTLDMRGGASYSGGPWLVRGGLTAGQYYLNNAHLRDTTGATVDWRMALASGSQITLGGNFTDARYVPTAQVTQNTQTTGLSVGWLTALGDGSAVFSLTASGGIERAIGGRDDGDRRFLGPRVLLQKSFSQTVGGYVSVGATNSKYDGINSLYLFQREENLYDLSAGVTWTLAKGLSLRPQFAYIKNNSNAELYTYDKSDLSINMRLDF